MAPILIDLTHTSHTRARTGVQRVARALLQTLGAGARPICHDPYLRAWRPLEPWETAIIAAMDPGARRGARWPLAARLRGRLKRVFLARQNRLDPLGGGAFLAPEIFSPVVAAALPGLFSTVAGPRGAIFHDSIALTHPELTPPGSVARAPAYLRELAGFDGVAAVSHDSRDRLVEHWRGLGLRDPPPVAAIPLGIDLPPSPPAQRAAASPVILSVGTIEGRKNHLALLEACELLWARGIKFELRLIGLAQRQTGSGALRRIRELKRAGRPLAYLGAVGDAAREEAYAACEFTVYPSLAEGFGLPIAESVARGRPCICLGSGALGEIARGGGCLTVESANAGAFAAAIELLLSDPEKRTLLAAAAKMRPVRTWSDYSRDVAAWIRDLPRRNSGPPTMGHST